MTPDNREEQVREALDRLTANVYDPTCQAAKDAATIRAHIEALEADKARLEAWANGPDGVLWYIERYTAAEARMRELEGLLRTAVVSSEALVYGAHGSLAMLPQQTKRWVRAMAAAKDYLAAIDSAMQGEEVRGG